MKKILAFLFFIPIILSAQELDARVTANFDKLPVVNKGQLGGFAQSIEDYLNNNRYSGEDWKWDKIKCTFNVFFMSAPDETHYTAQVNVTSIRPVERSTSPSLMFNILDNSWEFQFERDQSMFFTPDVDPLTDFLDFYAYVIIGLNEDSFSKLGGTKYYTEALNLALLNGNNSSAKGWDKNSKSYSRRGLVEDLLNERYRVFREDYFDYHYNGLDLFSTDKKKAQKNIIKLVDNLEVLRSKYNVYGVLMKAFFDAKHGEIVSMLSDITEKQVFHKLRKIDPPHQVKYDEVINRE